MANLVTYNVATSSVTEGIADGGTATCSGTVLNYNNRVVMINVAWLDTSAGGEAELQSVTFDGNTPTLIQDTTYSGTYHLVSYYYVNPGTGSKSAVATFNDTGVDGISVRCIIGFTVLNNVHQTSPLGTFGSATGTDNNPTVTLASCTNKSIVVDCAAYANGTTSVSAVTAGASQILYYNATTTTNDSFRFRHASSKEKVTADGNITMSWTFTSTPGKNWAINAQEFKVCDETVYNEYYTGTADGSILETVTTTSDVYAT